MTSPEQNPIVPLMNAGPGPLAVVVESNMLPDGSKLLIMRLEHSTGSTVVGFDSEFAQSLAKQLMEQATGLVVPTSADGLKIATASR